MHLKKIKKTFFTINQKLTNYSHICYNSKMREDSFFVSKSSDFVEENLISLKGEEFMHLTKVLRHKVGDRVVCFYDGSDKLLCEIKSIMKQEALLFVKEKEKCEANPNKRITLFQGLPKQDKLELIAKMLTEIGISDIVPFSSKYTLGTLDGHKRERLNKIIVSACKQCGRTSLTKIHETKPLKEIDFSSYDLVILASEKEKETSFKDLRQKILTSQSIAYIVGAEGGFSDEEFEYLKDKSVSITLGSRILRTESASIILGGLIIAEKEV